MIIQITDKEMEKLLEFIDKGGKTIRLQSQTENIKVEIKQKKWWVRWDIFMNINIKMVIE